MRLNFDRMAHLAGLENEEPKLLNENAKPTLDEDRVRDIIREELEKALFKMLRSSEDNALKKVQAKRTLASASDFINSTSYGKIHPAPGPSNTQSDTRSPGMHGFVGGLGFH